MSDITKELSLPEPVELTHAELDAVAAGVGVFGARASEIAQTATQTLREQGTGAVLHEQGGWGPVVQEAHAGGASGRDIGQAISGRTA